VKPKLALVIVLLIFINNCFSQDIKWQETKKWKLYNIQEFAVFNYPLDTLKNFTSITLDKDLIQTFLTTSVKLPKDEYSVWMGLYFATCEFPEGKVRKIEISVFGGFFYDEITKSYYQLPLKIRNDWIDYISVNFKKIK